MNASTACTAQRKLLTTGTSNFRRLRLACPLGSRTAEATPRPRPAGPCCLESNCGCRETPRRFDYESMGHGGPSQEFGMKYLCLVYPKEEVGPTAEQTRELFALRAAASEAGVYVDAGRLTRSDAATTLHNRSGVIVLTDGPFAEIEEHVGGYVMFDCPDLDAALDWAARIPGVRDGAIEIRPLMELNR